MPHDEHFLSRISRLEREHAELALGLYYDSALVKYVLGQAAVAESFDRVALSLDDPVQGPFVIVARNGHFVTCLGRGMKIPSDQALVTREKLDRLSQSIDALRELLDQAGSDDRRSTQRLFRRVREAGDRLSREEFEELAAWTPLVGAQYVSAAIEAGALAEDVWDKLAGVRNLNAPRHATALRTYWTASWLTAHMAMLLGTDDGAWLTRFFRDTDPDRTLVGGRTALFPGMLAQLSTTPFLARAAWITGKLPTLLLPDLERGYGAIASVERTISNGVGLIAVGLRNEGYRARVRTALAGAPAGSRDDYQAVEMDMADALREWFGQFFEAASERVDELRAHVIPIARDSIVDLLTEETGVAPVLPEEVCVPLMLGIPIGLSDHQFAGLRILLDYLPWICRAEAGDLYVPRAHRPPAEEPFEIEDAIALVEARRLRPGPPPKMQRRSEKVPRNAPCPCGSGTKYKKCCGKP